MNPGVRPPHRWRRWLIIAIGVVVVLAAARMAIRYIDSSLSERPAFTSSGAVRM